MEEIVMTDENIIVENQPAKLNKKSLTLLLILIAILGIFVTTYIRQQKEAKIQQQLIDAQYLINHGQFNDAILILNQVVISDPNRIKAYELRSTAYGNSRSNVYSEQESYYVNSIHDIDKMIELQPTNGNNYVNKDLLLRALAELPPDSATKFAIYELANDNAEKAIELGVTQDYSYVYRHHARNLIESNHCKDGLKETQALVNQTNPQDPIMSTYNIYLTEAYICLGNLDEALKTAQKIQCDDPVATCRSGFMAEVYYQAGEVNKALEILNNMINTNPASGGWRYFIRADIYYEMGETELALQDLATGDNYTWYGNGVYWYVKAKLAFDENDTQNGLLYLQYAESTLDVQYTVLRQKILKELKARGGNPLIAAPQVPLTTTPIP